MLYKRIKPIIILFVCGTLFLASAQNVVAETENISEAIFSRYIDDATIKKGYEVKGFEDRFQVAIFPSVFNVPTRVELKNRSQIIAIENNRLLAKAGFDPIMPTVAGVSIFDELVFAPDGWKVNSEIYEFDVLKKEAFLGDDPLVITLTFNKDTNNRQKVFYFDKGKEQWISLPSTVNYEDKTVRSIIHLPYAKLAIFEHNETPCKGGASWYKYKDCNCAASPDYPKGTKLKVTALHNNKSVIVTVNDYGPDRSIFPERVIDLDVEAFKVLANKRAGVIDVKVEPLDEICSYAFEKAKHPISPPPQISSKYAIIIDEPTGEIFYQKEAKKQVSIASITKLITADIFIGLVHTPNPLQYGGQASQEGNYSLSWDKVITYNDKDDLAGARLYVDNGETMTIDNLFYSTLVGSANNGAKSLVRNSGLSEEEFIKEMNDKAKKWKLEDTVFKDITGLNTGNVSTAFDVAMMARKIFKNLKMLEATTLSQYSFKTINTKSSHIIKSTNQLLLDKDLYITGAKTGFLNEAGYCLVLKAKNRDDGREFIGVILGAETSAERFDDMKKLIMWGLGG
ncbi:RlpA-like double-psi beta-barrel domain-containing protein [Patescibacteria group bacterium]